MSTKITTLLALVATLTTFVHAIPPACVIAAVNTQTNPHDVASVCRASDVQDYITKNCGGAQEAAQKYFSEVCSGAGVTVSATVPEDSSSSSSSDGGSSTSSSGNGGSSTVPSSTNNQSQAEVSTSSGSGETPSATGGAARMSMDVVGLVAVGCFGLMVAL